MGRLDGVRAVITGAASGIGEATTRLFVREGASVVMADLDVDRGERIAAELGDFCRFLPTDVAKEGAVDAAVALAVSAFGGLDCMFNNAGNPGTPGPIEEMDVASFDRTIGVHVRGVFLGIRAAARVMRPQGHGSIVNTASVAGLSAGYGPHDYSAAKAAIIHLTKTAANELGEDRVRVNAICPGAVPTAIYGRGAGLEGEAAQRTVSFMAQALSDASPMRRAAEPVEIGEVALWLASDASGYINGQAIVVDGGLITGPLLRNRPVSMDTLKEMLIAAAAKPEDG